MIQVCVLNEQNVDKKKWEIVFDYRVTRCTDKYKAKKKEDNKLRKKKLKNHCLQLKHSDIYQ